MPGVAIQAGAAEFQPLGAGPDPTPPLSTIVIEGDSISSTSPGQTDQAADPFWFSYAWKNAHPDKTVQVRAQGSRIVGDAGTQQAGNSMYAQVASDLAYAPQLITAMIGTNDLGSATAATYLGWLRGVYASYKAAGAKFAWSPPPPMRSAPPRQGNYDAFTAQRAALFAADLRNPAVWGHPTTGWCD